MPPASSNKKLLLIGASRGLGFALAAEYLKRGWHVVATERDRTRSKLPNLLGASGGRLEIETVDIVYPDQVAALRGRLASRKFDLLFVNAGVKNDDQETIADVSTDEFTRVMITNALSPMRVVEDLQDLVLPSGTIGIMCSGQGSISNNENGHHEVYRGSKAALNMFMRSFAARHADDPRTLLLMERGLTSPARSSSASAPRLPDADHPNERVVRPEISRFPCRDLPYMPRSTTTPSRPNACAFASGRIAFHVVDRVGARNHLLARLNGWPARTPTDASPIPSRRTAHGSGPMRIATPSSQWTFTT